MRGIVAVATSGGRDSTALLHATAVAAQAQDLQVLALHIHHGLQPDADAWFDHVRTQCERWAVAGLPVRFAGHRLTGRPARGDSIEAWAREARYTALAALARAGGATAVLLAHHRRDQAETFLLQALRGAGVAGLSAMPARVERDGLVWLRPWLDRSRDSIEAYLAQHRLGFIDDGSNTDPRFARNRLRLAVWPALTRAFPDAEVSLGAAARWAQQASRVLDDVAAADLLSCADAGGLRVAAWQALGPDRGANALRLWLRGQVGAAAPASLVARLQGELAGTGPGQWPLGQATLRRYRGRLTCHHARADVESLRRETGLRITRGGRYRLPGWGGELVASRVAEGGVPIAWLAHLDLRARGGGEQFQAGLQRPARSLKKQYQAAGVPEWERDGPLVFSGGQLLFVPGLGIDARVVGLPGQAQLALHWHRLPVTEA
ncbi:tRNA lysidine(34) synthetase TilS [Rhizobacter sp. Root1221]|uniref:tRNA lysidine(34) synthetase TilS n=1 Tax=Rhizobacter sp. Root1221 TaxID=1736433 RepID=UPI00070024C4|nr:tRNA lysidine(34) synthetase TilS [Rhizobacter sp. Root1221]KQV85399.1 tRNA(Ile)-lysidine synthase [Rhizobacter sp. Root1221]